MTPMHPDAQEAMNPFDALERVRLELLAIDALANAASTNMDECPPPRESRRSFDRAHALIGSAAEKAAAAVALAEELMASLRGAPRRSATG